MTKILNPGELNERVSILSINSIENSYAWETTTKLWAKVETVTGNNLFSRVGLGAKSVKFTTRKKSSLTLYNAFSWNGKHCFLTDIKEIDRAYFEVTTALIEPIVCSVERTAEPTLDGLNRPIYVDSNVITFPACITEKYVRQTQENPMSTIENCYVLVTPKVVELINGELVTINNVDYEVLVSHTLDDYKNEYEVRVRSES